MRREARRTPLLFIDRDGAKQDSGLGKSNLPSLSPVARDTLQEQAYLRLREALMSGHFVPGRWEIEVVAGPNDDWIDSPGQQRFLASDWKLSGKSSRTGFRLQGPRWTFAEKATRKLPEHGQEPSNILDHGYPLGAINLAGQTPIILVNDAPSTGGFINPYTVATAAFWKLAQSRPGDIYRFHAISLHDAQALRRRIDAL